MLTPLVYFKNEKSKFIFFFPQKVVGNEAFTGSTVGLMTKACVEKQPLAFDLCLGHLVSW